MRLQELGTQKRQKRVRDEAEESSPISDEPDPGEASNTEELFAVEDEDDQETTPDIPIQDEEDAIPSRLSFKPRQSTVTTATATPSHFSSPPQTFVELGVSSSLVAGMNKMSIHTPTEVQIACIPPLLDGMGFSHLVLPPLR
jgi:ATP-dependent RNA helicase DDX49/DBP8